MATSACLVATRPPPSNSISSSHKQHKPQFSSLPFSLHIPTTWNPHQIPQTQPITAFLGMGLFLVSTSSAFPASAAEIPILGLQEPDNALSLPTWAIHVSSVVEWITAMVLVWEYGEKSGYNSWKGLSWGMDSVWGKVRFPMWLGFPKFDAAIFPAESEKVPLLGGAFCACTWHFFYNSESLEVLVALQAALTVIGNFTMCIAAFRIYKSMQGGSENP